MYPTLSPKAAATYEKLVDFVEKECIPAEKIFEEEHAALPSRWMYPPIVDKLKRRARQLGLWNLFLMEEGVYHSGLTMSEYAVMSEVMGRSFLAPQACNCNAPDTGNMEVLAKYGTKEQRERWLKPLMEVSEIASKTLGHPVDVSTKGEGHMRSTFLMTEPAVASSDASNIETSIIRDGDDFVINGRKWWSTGAMDPYCRVAIVMGKSSPSVTQGRRHREHSMIIVPMDTPGVKIVRPLTVFGYDDAPHGHAEVLLENVRVPHTNLLMQEGDGFKIAQGRLGPGRIHHCMRAIGLAERVLGMTIQRSMTRKTFGQELARHETVQKEIAEARMSLEQARLLVLHTAWRMDMVGARGAQQEIAMIKVVAPNMAQKVLDFAIQLHGGKGVSDDTMLARAFAGMRTLRIADGPDEVHVRTVARFELKRAMDHYQGATSPAMTTTPPPLADAWYRSQGRGGSEATLRPSIAPPSKL